MKSNRMSFGLFSVFFFFLVFSAVTFAQQKKFDTIAIKTSAVCGMCKDRIEGALAFEKGVKSSTLDVETKVVTVIYNPLKTTPGKLRTAISKVGYDADTVAANEAAYNRLPPCCKKDAPKH